MRLIADYGTPLIGVGNRRRGVRRVHCADVSPRSTASRLVTFWLITCDIPPPLCRRLGTATSAAPKMIDGWIIVLPLVPNWTDAQTKH